MFKYEKKSLTGFVPVYSYFSLFYNCEKYTLNLSNNEHILTFRPAVLNGQNNEFVWLEDANTLKYVKCIKENTNYVIKYYTNTHNISNTWLVFTQLNQYGVPNFLTTNNRYNVMANKNCSLVKVNSIYNHNSFMGTIITYDNNSNIINSFTGLFIFSNPYLCNYDSQYATPGEPNWSCSNCPCEGYENICATCKENEFCVYENGNKYCKNSYLCPEICPENYGCKVHPDGIAECVLLNNSKLEKKIIISKTSLYILGSILLVLIILMIILLVNKKKNKDNLR